MYNYHRISKEGPPPKDGQYMVKFFIEGRPEFDCTELVFRTFRNGKCDVPYYSDPETDRLIGWYD